MEKPFQQKQNVFWLQKKRNVIVIPKVRRSTGFDPDPAGYGVGVKKNCGVRGRGCGKKKRRVRGHRGTGFAGVNPVDPGPSKKMRQIFILRSLIQRNDLNTHLNKIIN